MKMLFMIKINSQIARL